INLESKKLVLHLLIQPIKNCYETNTQLNSTQLKQTSKRFAKLILKATSMVMMLLISQKSFSQTANSLVLEFLPLRGRKS
ncbi:MAG: hypothetical protein ACRDFB_06080, partial [Rhabdochlamydiaceae bacterium]